MNRRSILREHYLRVMRKFGTWASLAALVGTLFLPASSFAAVGQLSARKGTLSTSVANTVSATSTFVFNPSVLNSGATIKGIKFEICDSPLESVTCVVTNVAGSTMASATAGVQSGTNITNQYGTPAYTGATAVTFKNATGNALASGNAVTFPVNVIHLPTAANVQFYFRITTYNSDTTFNGTTEIDFGAMAEGTTNSLAVTANVQESIVFCVGTSGATCTAGAITGATVTLAPNPMTASAISKGTAVMACATNATSGYVITYNGTTFTDTTSDTITAAATGGVAPNTGGTEQFGFTLKQQTSGALSGSGANPTGGTGALVAPYDTNNQIAYNTAGGIAVANSAGAPSAETLFTMVYAANVSNLTKPGQYTATQTFIATGTF
jgi:hypothetical protein